MKTINNSAGKPNYSQRLNPDDESTPWNETLETCNVTSAVTAMVTAGYDMDKLNKGFHPRPPVDLLQFMRRNQDCLDLYNKLDPTNATPMNEYMDVLALAIGLYIGLPSPLSAQYGASLTVVIGALVHGDGAVIHGQYTFNWPSGKGTIGGHFQSLAGLVYNDESEVQSLIIDDPFGNPLTNYVDTAGDNIEVDYGWFRMNVKPLGQIGKDIIIIPKAS